MSILVDYVLHLLYPPKCMICRKLLVEEQDLCHDCRADAPWYPYGLANPAPKAKTHRQFLDSLTAVWYYENGVRKSIHQYKFRRRVMYAQIYGRLLAVKLLEQGPEAFDILTWVPVSSKRKRSRGYDQCELLAKAVASELGVTAVPALKKIRHTPPQSGLKDYSTRKANVMGAFVPANKQSIAGKRILLLDDVYTTGATTEECARVLLTAGASEVHCAVIAVVRN